MNTEWYDRGLVAARALTGVASRFLAGKATLFRRLRVRHVGAINTQNTAAVYRTLETAQSAVDGFVVANFDSYWQGAFLSRVIKSAKELK